VVLEIELTAGAVPEPARVVERYAARAVIVEDGRLLLLRSRHGDHKFPGGGVEPGETAADAVARELREECGLTGVTPGELIARVVERRAAQEPDAVFVMVSDYYRVAHAVESVATALEDYERDLDLTPVWVAPARALAANLALLETWAPKRVAIELPWLARETRVLQELSR